MNTQTPLIREGITAFRGRPTFFLKVMLTLAVHVVVIGGMLLQGCKNASSREASASNIPAPDPTAANPDTSNLPTINKAAISNTMVNTQQNPVQILLKVKQSPSPNPLATQPAAVTPIELRPVVASAKAYVILSGDTFRAIAHKNGVGLTALMNANPGINPKKLQVGQKVQLPARI